jgi:hypothetical protein
LVCSHFASNMPHSPASTYSADAVSERADSAGQQNDQHGHSREELLSKSAPLPSSLGFPLPAALLSHPSPRRPADHEAEPLARPLSSKTTQAEPELERLLPRDLHYAASTVSGHVSGQAPMASLTSHEVPDVIAAARPSGLVSPSRVHAAQRRREPVGPPLAPSRVQHTVQHVRSCCQPSNCAYTSVYRDVLRSLPARRLLEVGMSRRCLFQSAAILRPPQ